MNVREVIELKQERQNLRQEINLYTRFSIQWDDEALKKHERLKVIHQKIVTHELLQDKTIKVRYGFAVCGYSEKHGYFRNKHNVFESLNQALYEFELLKSIDKWKIPTIIIKQSYLRLTSPCTVDFDKYPITWLGISDNQELIKKHMMGSRGFKWSYLLDDKENNFTY